MLFNILKFLVLIVIGIYEIIFIQDPFLNILSWLVIVLSLIFMMLGMVMPQSGY